MNFTAALALGAALFSAGERGLDAGLQMDAGAGARLEATVAAPPPHTFGVLQHLPGIDLIETVNEARHVHGGPPAQIGSAVVNFEVLDGKPHVISAKSLELLHGYCNDRVKWAERKHLAVVRYDVFDWTNPEAIGSDPRQASLPSRAERFQVKLSFAPFVAYQACDRFAYAMKLVIDGNPVEVELPLDVKRFEPLHGP